jgi:hypothetical protein
MEDPIGPRETSLTHSLGSGVAGANLLVGNAGAPIVEKMSPDSEL